MKKLTLTVNPKAEILDVLNKHLGKESKIKQLLINFIANSVNDQSVIKFPKYLKNLKSLIMWNIYDRNFTDTLFDLASQKRLKELGLGFI